MPQKKKKTQARRAAMADWAEDEHCLFCLAPRSQCDLLIRRSGALGDPTICDSCVGVAAQLVNEFHAERAASERVC